MKKGEKGILIFIGVFAVAAMGYKSFKLDSAEKDPGIPFYSTASNKFQKEGSQIVKEYDCRACHVLWAQRTIMQSVPAPSLDGLGSIRTEEWFYKYLSAENPQDILPTRLKAQFKMPSFSEMPDEKRKVLAKYLSSLKVEDWYLQETKDREYEKLTGKKPKP